MPPPARQPEGSPTGGQFAPSGHAEVDVDLLGVAGDQADSGAARNEAAFDWLAQRIESAGWENDGGHVLLNGSAADHAEILYDLLARLDLRPGPDQVPVDDY